jgi:hypothetical protein
LRFINQHSGTFRVVGGGIEDFTGLETSMIKPLQSLIKTLINENRNDSAV